jgi:hypothetical protein
VKIAKRVLVTLAIVMFGLLVWVGVFPPHHGRIPANEATAIRNIQRLNVAQQRYAARHLEVGFACNLNSLGQKESGLGIDDSIDPVLASGTRSGYHFELGVADPFSRARGCVCLRSRAVEVRGAASFAVCAKGASWFVSHDSPG